MSGAGPAQVQEATDESFLHALGIRRLPLPIPFLEAGGPVNAYAIEELDGGLALFDAGLHWPPSEQALRALLGEDLKRLRRVLVSHGHIDHFGLAQTLAEDTGAEVWVAPGDWEKVVGGGWWTQRLSAYIDYFRRLGADEEQIAGMIRAAEAGFRLARYVEPARARPWPLEQPLRFRHFEAQVLPMPGHTPGLVCLWAPTPRLLFADDHLLARVSPNPLLELGPGGEQDKFESLVQYLGSAERARSLDVDWVLPGHGPPFRGHRVVLDTLLGFYRARQEKLLRRCAQSEATAIDLVRALFYRADPSRLFLMLSEVVGNLEVLERAGRARRRFDAGVYRWSASSS